MLKKVFAWLHLWLGLLTGIVVFVVSITGGIHVFHEEFLEWFPTKGDPTAVVHQIPADGRRFLKPSEIVEHVQTREHGDSVALTPFMIRYFRDKGSILLTGDNQGDRTWYTFDPYTGEVLEQKIENKNGLFIVQKGQIIKDNLKAFEFFPFILDGHLNLWLPPAIGNPIVCYCTLGFVVLLISGIVLWWPKSKAAAKQRYWFRWKKSTKWRRKNYDLHNVNGFYVFIFLLLIAFTGLCIGLEWMQEGVHYLLEGHSEEDATTFKSVPPQDGKRAISYITLLDSVFAQEEFLYPEAHTYSMYWAFPSPKDPEATSMTVAYVGSDDYRSYYDRYTNKRIGMDEDEHEASLAHQLEHLYLPIHEGSIGGLSTKFLAFFASLISASLPITGVYIWWGRRNKKSSKRKA
ncbi:PepSY-associated TM helix domain-containing protein [Sphingobacterium sp. LRF_L2]|uniref:PepSY-associated TM helix domain-containing protein n=1 Tax=Sphingobacterium sp. LRF_L2 TaxID=3369421 RepID=UPI003F636D00